MADDQTLRELLDRQQLADLMARYCRGIDRMDRDLIASVFHEDARDEHGEYVTVGCDAIADGFVSMGGAFADLWHFIGNSFVEIDGDTATAETYFLASATIARDGSTYSRLRAGRYLDRYERRHGVWKVAHRKLVDDWSRVDEVCELAPGTSVSRGSAGGDDPSYDFLRLR